MNILSSGIEWLSKTKLSQKAKVKLQTAKDWLSRVSKLIGNWVTKKMDIPLYKAARKQGVDRETSKTIGGAVRWGTGVGGLGYSLTPDKEGSPIKGPGLQYPPGTFVPKNPN
jgi:hypothetical protein